ncbi:MAG: geranylgeranyl reductase family protein [Promethearchaeota archaeon]
MGLPLQCAGIVSQKLAKLLPLPAPLVLNRVSAARVVSPSGKATTMAGKERPLVIDRVGFDQWLFEKAEEAGARFSLGERLLEVQALGIRGTASRCKRGGTDARVSVRTTKGTRDADLLVGCDGPKSVVARSVGVERKLATGLQVRVKLDHPDDVASLYFSPRYRPLFGWVVPEGDGTCRVGVGTWRRSREALDHLLAKLGVDRSDVVDHQAGLIPVGPPGPVAFPGIALLGDAAGHVKASTGGGIVMLLTAGRVLADAILKINGGDGSYGRAPLRRLYERRLRAVVDRQLKVHHAINSLLGSFTSREFDRLLELYENTPVGGAFQLYGEMDFPLGFVLKLLRHRQVLDFLVAWLKRHGVRNAINLVMASKS